MSNYTIKQGDTLTGIAAAHHTTVDALVKENNIKNPDLIYAGNTITIPESGKGAATGNNKTTAVPGIGAAYTYAKPAAKTTLFSQRGAEPMSDSEKAAKAETLGTAFGIGLQGAGAAAGIALGSIGSLIGAGEYVGASLKLKQLLKEKPAYAQSEDLLDLQAKIDAAVSAPPAYQDSYKKLIEEKMREIEKRQPFRYDFTVDLAYLAYRDRYVKEGRLAMEDAMANAAALSGGYGNSYAAAAGNEAYQGYLAKLHDVIPTLQEQAYDRYRDEGEQMNRELTDLLGLQSNEQDAYKLQYSTYAEQLDNLFRQAETLSDEEWNAYLQKVKDWEYRGDLYQQQRENAADAFWNGGKLAAASLTDFGAVLADAAADMAETRRKQAQYEEETAYQRQRDEEKDKEFYDKLAWDKYKFYAKG